MAAQADMEAAQKQYKNYGKISPKSRIINFTLPFFMVLFLSFFTKSFSQFVVETLPGYNGSLPFKLETGYIGVGKNDEVQLFYYFIESESNPAKDPLVLWLTGGPGCSAFCAVVFEIGPLSFDFEAFDGSLPKLISNPHAWTKIASIIFVDSPVGAGFSYSNTFEGYHSSDHKAAEDGYTFLRKWLMKHPNFLTNPFYVGGDSYGGKFATLFTWKVSEGIEAGLQPRILLHGYVVGNPLTDGFIDVNARLPYAHRMGLISDEYYQMAKSNCHGNYVRPNPTNGLCLLAIQRYEQCIANIFVHNILEPNCKASLTNLRSSGSHFNPSVYASTRVMELPSIQKKPRCRDDTYVVSSIWANDPTVQEALHVKKGTIKEWIRCNDSLSYGEMLFSVLQYHQLLSKRGYKALAYSGDHDLEVPYTATLEWIYKLNLTVDERWRPWSVDDQVAGYTQRFLNKETGKYLTFATVKGGGHTAAEYKPRECFAMIDRFFSDSPL